MNHLHVAKTINALVKSGAHTATFYISPKETIRATRVRLKGRRKDDPRLDIVLTLGKPNFAARTFIKSALAAKEPFPIKKVQLKGTIDRVR